MSSGTEPHHAGLNEQARKRLEDELVMLREQRGDLGDGRPGEDGVGDMGDSAESLRRADDRARVADRIAEVTRMLAGGGPPSADSAGDELPDGTKITVRHGDGTVESLRAVARTEEVPPGEENSSLTLDSPLGQALAGHGVGDTVGYDTPDGPRQVEIVEVKAPG